VLADGIAAANYVVPSILGGKPSISLFEFGFIPYIY
jgi:hypothetical protein